MIKSSLRYPGGKSKAIKQISLHIPQFDEYREPFVGGGSVFIYLKQKYPRNSFWINDIYESLFYFWKECRDNVEGLISQIREWKGKFDDGKVLHRFLIDNIELFDPVKKAAAFFVFNRITFSGTTESGGFSNAAFQKRFTESSIDRAYLLSSILSNVEITNLGYEDIVLKPGENVFMFLDPPYYSATKSALYGKNGKLHKGFDHERFADVIRQSNHKWLITYDDCEYIRELFSFANIRSWQLTYGMRNVTENSNQKGKELFISNFDIDLFQNNQLSLLKK